MCNQEAQAQAGMKNAANAEEFMRPVMELPDTKGEHQHYALITGDRIEGGQN